MKKLLFLWISLAVCLALSACGGKDSISGEVMEATSSALILETDAGKRIAVLLEEDTYISGIDNIDGDHYKAAPHTGVQVSFFPARRAGSVAAADGAQVEAYRADHVVRIEAYLIPEAVTLSDGTALNAWKTGLFGTNYHTGDGVELLRESAPSGPENYYVGNLESFDDLSETAKPQVSAFYENQGKLYDLQAELEQAWAAYRANPSVFSSFWVQQDTSPAASGEQIFYFRTDLSQTLSGNIAQTTTLCAAFDRETGENLPLADLFLCPKKDIGKNLLDLAAQAGTGPADPVLRAEMEAAFRMEFLSFSPDDLWLEFPQGTLPSQEHTCLVSVKFSEDCKALLHPWAVPYPSTQ